MDYVLAPGCLEAIYDHKQIHPADHSKTKEEKHIQNEKIKQHEK